jgi:hypothetical protein
MRPGAGTSSAVAVDAFSAAGGRGVAAARAARQAAPGALQRGFGGL